MRNIILLCNAGLSTSILVKKMEEEAKKIGYEVTIAAYPVGQARDVGKDADIVVLGPQIMYMEKIVRQQLHCPIIVIDHKCYGMMDGKGVLATVRKTLGDR